MECLWSYNVVCLAGTLFAFSRGLVRTWVADPMLLSHTSTSAAAAAAVLAAILALALLHY